MAQKFITPIAIKQLSSAGSDGLTIFVDQETFARLQIQGGGRLVWGDGTQGGDVNLYRDEANVLKTDDTFKVPTLFIDGIEVDTTGAASDQVLKFNGTKFLPGTAAIPFTGYDYEIHVSQVDGNDTTGNGDLLTPVASITKALTLITSLRKTIIVHPGTYTESPSITTQYTTITGPGLIGGNIIISGTLTTNTACTIAGIKMTNLTISTPAGLGNVNILNCEISGTLTKSSNADYVNIRVSDIANVNVTGAGLTVIFGSNPNYITVNNASAAVIAKSVATIAPVLTAGTLSIVDSYVYAGITNAVTSAASSFIVLANSQFITANLSNVAPVVLNGFYSIFNCAYDKPSSTLVATSGTGGPTNSIGSIDYFQYINADKFITQGGTSGQFVKGDGSLDSVAYAPLATPTFTGTVSGITKSMVGLGSVDNTADTAKPISIAQQTALDLKANSATPTFTGMATIPKITVGGIEIDTTSPADTNVLKYSSSLNKYLPGVATVVATLDDLTDVVAPTPSPDQVLAWDTGTSKWVNKTFSSSVETLDAIGNVSALSPSSGDYLKWNGTAWVNSATSYSATIGDGSATSFVLTHNLNTREVVVSLVSTTSPYESYHTDWNATTENTITVYFASAPGLNSIKVKILS